MASKKKSTKPARIGDLTGRHIAGLQKQIDAHHTEMLGLVKAFKLDVAVNFRELQETLVKVIAQAVAQATLETREADRARMDALEARIKDLEKRAS